jgi:hypothetical protein
VLSYVQEEDVDGLFLDEDAFASFVYNCLSATIKKGTWRLGRNKKLVSHLFTPYDEALALLILENNADGIRDIIANGQPDKKTKIKTKYTCRKYFNKMEDGSIKKKRREKSDGGHQGWTKAGTRHFNELTKIVKESREHSQRIALEQRIKDSYVIRRSGNGGGSSDDEEDDSEDESDNEPVYVCTGIPVSSVVYLH